MDKDTVIHYVEIDKSDASIYDEIEMKVRVKEIYEVNGNGLDGITFQKKKVSPYTKDFTENANYKRWKRQFDLENWNFFVAFDGNRPVGGAVLCGHSSELNMLEGREDLGVLWDIRVDNSYKHCGVGQRLFQLVKDKAENLGLIQLKIECQNNNVPAVDFYFKQGAHIGAVNRYAYYGNKDAADEVQFLLYVNLFPGIHN